MICKQSGGDTWFSSEIMAFMEQVGQANLFHHVLYEAGCKNWLGKLFPNFPRSHKQSAGDTRSSQKSWNSSHTPTFATLFFTELVAKLARPSAGDTSSSQKSWNSSHRPTFATLFFMELVAKLARQTFPNFPRFQKQSAGDIRLLPEIMEFVETVGPANFLHHFLCGIGGRSWLCQFFSKKSTISRVVVWWSDPTPTPCRIYQTKKNYQNSRR